MSILGGKVAQQGARKKTCKKKSLYSEKVQAEIRI